MTNSTENTQFDIFLHSWIFRSYFSRVKTLPISKKKQRSKRDFTLWIMKKDGIHISSFERILLSRINSPHFHRALSNFTWFLKSEGIQGSLKFISHNMKCWRASFLIHCFLYFTFFDFVVAQSGQDELVKFEDDGWEFCSHSSSINV